MSIPNLITLARLVLVPVVIWLIVSGEAAAAFWLFVLAGVTDALDGFIAKRFKQATLLGAYLDPIADKMLLVSVFVTLGVVKALPLWFVILVVSRDVLIAVAFLIAYLVGKPIKVRPLDVSKANTAAQIVLVGVVLAQLGLGLGVGEAALQILIACVAILTGVSWLAYFAVWTQHLAGSPAVEPGSRENGENGRPQGR